MFSTYLFKLPWHKDDPRLYHYGLVPDEAERQKYNTAEKLLMRMDRNLSKALIRIEKHGLTPLPPFGNESVFRLFERWSCYERDFRKGNRRRHSLLLCGTPQYEHDRKMDRKAVKVIRNLHVFCSCAARIIQIAWSKSNRGSQLKAERKRKAQLAEQQRRERERGTAHMRYY